MIRYIIKGLIRIVEKKELDSVRLRRKGRHFYHDFYLDYTPQVCRKECQQMKNSNAFTPSSIEAISEGTLRFDEKVVTLINADDFQFGIGYLL